MRAKIYRECPTCKIQFNAPKSRIYCSAECRIAAPKKPAWNKGLSGFPTPKHTPKNGTDKTCEKCGKIFYKSAHGGKAKFCSMKCYHEARWNGSRKEIRRCVICNTEFTVFRCETDSTCSKECKNKHKRNCHLGEKSHFWRGGKTAPYHSEWRVNRYAALERDGFKCVLCDSVKILNVHHKIPYRYSKSHALENLITLCRSCHSKEELLVNKEFAAALVSGRQKGIKIAGNNDD